MARGRVRHDAPRLRPRGHAELVAPLPRADRAVQLRERQRAKGRRAVAPAQQAGVLVSRPAAKGLAQRRELRVVRGAVAGCLGQQRRRERRAPAAHAVAQPRPDEQVGERSLLPPPHLGAARRGRRPLIAHLGERLPREAREAIESKPAAPEGERGGHQAAGFHQPPRRREVLLGGVTPRGERPRGLPMQQPRRKQHAHPLRGEARPPLDEGGGEAAPAQHVRKEAEVVQTAAAL